MNKRLTVFGVAVLVAAAGAMTRIDFTPLAAVRLVRPNGVAVGYGFGATTDTARGAALDAAIAAAVDGDQIEVYGDCRCTNAIKKNGVRVIPRRGAVITRTANFPAITPNSFPSSATTLVNRRRDAFFASPEPEFCFWHHDFSTSANTSDTVFATSNGTRTEGQGVLRLTTPSTGTATMLANRRITGCAQLVASVRVEALNAVGTYNDVGVGFALTSTATSDTISDKIVAFYRRTAADPTGKLVYTYTYDSGGGLVYKTETLTTPLVAPFDLMLWLNHNSAVVCIREQGRERIMVSPNAGYVSEVNEAVLDLEDEATVARLRPCLFFQTDGAEDATVSNWEVRAPGTLGDREHYPATYEDGEPIRDANGLYYVTADACGPNAVTLGGPIEHSEYMKNQSTTRFYCADTGRFAGQTAKYCVKKNGKIFGAQQGKILYDRRTGLYHWYSSEWNDTSDRVQMVHYQTHDNLLHGYWVLDSTQFDVIDTSGWGAQFDTENFYDTDVIRDSDGYWYLCGTVGNQPVVDRSAFCVRGTSPNSFTTLKFISSTTDEGTRFWRVGGTTYVATAISDGTVKVMNRDTGATVKSITMPGDDGYPPQCSLLPFVRGGRTQYQVISFSDSTRGTGDDYKADYTNTVQTLAFGGTIVTNLGEWAGEEFTDQPRGFNP